MARPRRLDGVSYVGSARYFLTFCAFERRTFFLDTSLANLTLLQFRRSARLKDFAILAYCLMPDHAHLLVEGTEPRSDLRSFVKHAKQGSAQRCAALLGGALWQEGYYERVVRPGDDARAIATYIVWNPVRAGLVQVPSDYPFAGSDVWPLHELR